MKESFEVVQKKINGAIQELLEKDNYLLEKDCNERAISHRLAIYLEKIFEEWDVDCEYNRNHDDVKRLQIFPRKISSDDTQATSVYPDIIIHKRNSDKNLLVIEMKKTTSREDKGFDIEKLNAFKNELHYVYALFLEVKTKNKIVGLSKIEWI